MDLAIRMPGEKGAALGLYLAQGDAWQAELETIVGLNVSLQLVGFTDEFDEIVNREDVWLWAREVTHPDKA